MYSDNRLFLITVNNTSMTTKPTREHRIFEKHMFACTLAGRNPEVCSQILKDSDVPNYDYLSVVVKIGTF